MATGNGSGAAAGAPGAQAGAVWVQYTVQGERGEEDGHPNAYRVPVPAGSDPRALRVGDVTAAFPLHHLGAYHFRFKVSAGGGKSHVFLDLANPDDRAPTFNGGVVLRAMRLDRMRCSTSRGADRRLRLRPRPASGGARGGRTRGGGPSALPRSPPTAGRNRSRSRSQSPSGALATAGGAPLDGARTSSAPRERPPAGGAAGATADPRRPEALRPGAGAGAGVPAAGAGPSGAQTAGAGPASPSLLFGAGGAAGKTPGAATAPAGSPNPTGSVAGDILAASAAAAAERESRPRPPTPEHVDDDLRGKSATVQAAVMARRKELKRVQDTRQVELDAAAAHKLHEQAQQRECKARLGPALDAWAKETGGELRDIRVLISTMHKVLWPGAKWEEVGFSKLVQPARVRAFWMKAGRVVHPDKQRTRTEEGEVVEAPPEQKYIAHVVQLALNEAYAKFAEANGL